MNILVVGSILKDVYLNLDARGENFEIDGNGTRWLDLGFDASEHHFFSRFENFGGAAVTLEVLQELGIESSISGSKLDFADYKDEDTSGLAHRYILISDEQVCYFAPSKFHRAVFEEPRKRFDYIYLDRSAVLDGEVEGKILDYLKKTPETQLIMYTQNLLDKKADKLLARADLIFVENWGNKAVNPDAPTKECVEMKEEMLKKRLNELDQDKLIYISDTEISYQDIKETISMKRVDELTHLSAYSIMVATVLGCFVLGYSVEKSLMFARLNVENARLDGSLSLKKLKQLSEKINEPGNLELIAASLVRGKKGILAADESGGSIHKKFEALSIPDNETTRRDYRNMLLSTWNLGEYVNGVIMFDETTKQKANNGDTFVDYLISRQIIPGVKVDEGLELFDNSEETFTKGLDGLNKRLVNYYNKGLRFAKWRAAFTVTFDENGELLTPSERAIKENCRILAEYASVCQENGLVPIVEPELVYDGDYSVAVSAEKTGQILDELFKSLAEKKVKLAGCLLKVNMVMAGKKYREQSPASEVGKMTAEVLRSHVPSELAGVVFLSGGQMPEQATENLAAIEQNGPYPWPVTFSFARALQGPALEKWRGDNTKTREAQEAFTERLKANQEALEECPE